jgi:hypothetical protein
MNVTLAQRFGYSVDVRVPVEPNHPFAMRIMRAKSRSLRRNLSTKLSC